MNPTYSTAPLVCEYTGYATVPVGGAANPNTIINTISRAPSTSNAAGAALGLPYTMSPDGRMPVVLYPTVAYNPAVATNTFSFTIMLDCRAYNAEIIYASAAYCPPPSATPGALAAYTQSGSMNCVGIDAVNKFVYFTIISTSGNTIAPQAGATLHFDIAFHDTLSV
jgi:hypothetical protein